jgi:hypothetical protein
VLRGAKRSKNEVVVPEEEVEKFKMDVTCSTNERKHEC